MIFIDDGQPRNRINYGFNRGDWYVWGVPAAAPRPTSPFRANSCVRLAAITDGLSNTLFAVDVKTHTTDLIAIREENGGPTFAAVTARSYHPGCVNALFGEGSVHFIKNTISAPTWRALGTVYGGEVISADSY